MSSHDFEKDEKYIKYKQKLLREIEDLQYRIDRAYKTKEAGFYDIFLDDFKRLHRKSLVSSDGKDMWIKSGELEKRLAVFKKKNPISERYYVYQALGIKDEILYIGKGTGDRYKHCNSGASSCAKLNKYFFENGEDSVRVEIVKYFPSNAEAKDFEESLIIDLKPICNTRGFNLF